MRRVMEPGHRITLRIRNILHFRQLFGATRGKVQERQAVEIFGLLVGLFDNLDRGKEHMVRKRYQHTRELGRASYDCPASTLAGPAVPSIPADR
jgi:hypothetical protein